MSIATTIRQQHEAKEHEQRQRAGDRYTKLVRAAAAGKEPPFEQIEQAARDAETQAEMAADSARQARLTMLVAADRFPERRGNST